MVLMVLMAGGMAASAQQTASVQQKVAVFPFELLDSSQEGELIVKIRPEETKRLEMLTADLKLRLAADGRFALVDLTPFAAEITAAAPLHRCNGCDGDLAKKTGANLAMLGLVQKFSDTLLSVSVQIVDGSTGAVKASYSAGVQGNTEEAWLRALGHIVKNRITNQGPSQ